MNGFPKSIADRYRTRTKCLAPRVGETPAEYETTIPLRGDRGHVYIFGPGWAGVWLNSRRPVHSLNKLASEFPDLIRQQVGDGECTFRVPMPDLDGLLVTLGAKTVARWADDDPRREELRERMNSINRERWVESLNGSHASSVQNRRSLSRTPQSTPEVEIGV